MPVSQVVVLGSPGGTAYEVARPDPTSDAAAGLSWRHLVLRSWQPGSTTALVSAYYPETASGDGSGYYPLYDLDLLTGTLTLSDQDLGISAGDGGPMLLAVANGRAVWLDTTGGRSRLLVGGRTLDVPGTWNAMLSPDERYLTVGDRTVVDLETLTTVGALPWADWESCDPLAWWTATTVSARCTDADPLTHEGPLDGLHPRLETFDVDRLAAGQGTGAAPSWVPTRRGPSSTTPTSRTTRSPSAPGRPSARPTRPRSAAAPRPT